MKLTINGKEYSLEVEADTPLLWVLRDELGMTGTKFGCGVGQCGACTVHVNGVATRSCSVPVSALANQSITTIENVSSDALGKKVVEVWVENQVAQCGYCQSGQVMAAVSLLQQNPNPSDADIDDAMTNICRCGTYNAIRGAVKQVASEGVA